MFDDLKIEIATNGDVTFKNSSGDDIGATSLSDLNNALPFIDPLTLRMYGIGRSEPESPLENKLSLNVGELSLPSDYLLYSYKDIILISTSITKISASDGVVTIDGAGDVNGNSGYTFAVAVKDNSPDEMSITIFQSDIILHDSGTNHVTKEDLDIFIE